MQLKQLKRSALAGICAAALSLSFSTTAQADDVLFWSTQAKPVKEAQAMREQVLSGFAGGNNLFLRMVCRL